MNYLVHGFLLLAMQHADARPSSFLFLMAVSAVKPSHLLPSDTVTCAL